MCSSPLRPDPEVEGTMRQMWPWVLHMPLCPESLCQAPLSLLSFPLVSLVVSPIDIFPWKKGLYEGTPSYGPLGGTQSVDTYTTAVNRSAVLPGDWSSAYLFTAHSLVIQCDSSELQTCHILVLKILNSASLDFVKNKSQKNGPWEPWPVWLSWLDIILQS